MVRTLAIVLFILGTIVANYVLLSEAYGDGPPYYGRTVNMDKWTSPLPILIPVDLVAVATISWSAARWARRR
jgi:hypothetical protein